MATRDPGASITGNWKEASLSGPQISIENVMLFLGNHSSDLCRCELPAGFAWFSPGPHRGCVHLWGQLEGSSRAGPK